MSLTEKFNNNYSIGLETLKNTDQIFSNLYEKYGYLHQRRKEPSFRSFVETIVGQQLSGKAANTIFNRLELLFDGELIACRVCKISVDRLRSAGLSRAKASYIINLAKVFQAKPNLIEDLSGKSNKDLFAFLVSLKGIGPWTAQIIMLFNFNRIDIFPQGDVTLEKAFAELVSTDLDELPKYIQSWSPYAGAVAMYLWTHIDAKN